MSPKLHARDPYVEAELRYAGRPLPGATCTPRRTPAIPGTLAPKWADTEGGGWLVLSVSAAAVLEAAATAAVDALSLEEGPAAAATVRARQMWQELRPPRSEADAQIALEQLRYVDHLLRLGGRGCSIPSPRLIAFVAAAYRLPD